SAGGRLADPRRCPGDERHEGHATAQASRSTAFGYRCEASGCPPRPLASQSTLALLTVPLFTGVIGYVTNWTGVLMLFYPVHFKGLRAPWIHSLARLLPYKL